MCHHVWLACTAGTVVGCLAQGRRGDIWFQYCMPFLAGTASGRMSYVKDMYALHNLCCHGQSMTSTYNTLQLSFAIAIGCHCQLLQHMSAGAPTQAVQHVPWPKLGSISNMQQSTSSVHTGEHHGGNQAA